jgi:hypothetical protein
MASETFRKAPHLRTSFSHTTRMLRYGSSDSIYLPTMWNHFDRIYRRGNAQDFIAEAFDGSERSAARISDCVFVRRVTPMITLTTDRYRKISLGVDGEIMTDKGMQKVSDLGVGAGLIGMDMFKMFYGDAVRLDMSGNGRVRAILRNHNFYFKIGENGETITKHHTIFCVDYDREPVEENGVITVGLNTYRDTVNGLYNLSPYTVDRVAKIEFAAKNIGLAVFVEDDDCHNLVFANGAVCGAARA